MKQYADFIKQYKGFEGLSVKLDYLNMKPGDLCVKSEKYEPVVKTYTDGAKLKQCVFSVCLKEARVPLTKESISNIGILKGFLNWLEIRDGEGDYLLPGIGVSITAITDVQTESSDIGCNVYSIKLRYLYYTEE